MRLIFVANSPSPNTVELYNALHRRNDTEVTVAYLTSRNAKWKEADFPIKHDVMPTLNLSPFPTRVNTAFCPGLVIRLLFGAGSSKIIIQGYSNPTNFLLILAMCFLRPRADWAFWGERIKISDVSSPLARLVKRLVIFSISKSKRVYGVGRAGVESYSNHGVPERLLRNLPYTKNFAVYNSYAGSYGNKSIVTAARLVESKKIDHLIEAFSEVSSRYPDWSLEIIGHGPMRSRLENGVSIELRKKINFHGYAGAVRQAEIYSKSDIFVLPSMHDGWGMVVPEAMAAGLPVITTDGVIAGRDMIEEGRNGFVVPAGNVNQLTSILEQVLRGDHDLKKMGAYAVDTVSIYYPDKVSDGLMADISTDWRKSD